MYPFFLQVKYILNKFTPKFVILNRVSNFYT